MENWKYDEPCPPRGGDVLSSWARWLTASFWQDLYGIVPLFVGSLLVSVIALALRASGIRAAIYVSEIGTPGENLSSRISSSSPRSPRWCSVSLHCGAGKTPALGFAKGLV